ncbi:aldehyde dehydrogenase family protein [Tsukamurella spumae]|uniref:Aldehyde dehydrogenase n=1 Tax=Tsukamurella spumae TaxID=44753 RepID=A0A846X4N9_9ACTN|nr:aldehyde dehydrogenase family protein [Tsukamurella spumae]NKY20468.1 aldehyde dehydrogenase family protein [Tsukamurella spumae]
MSVNEDVFHRQRDYFRSGKTLGYEWRMDQLGRLERMLTENTGAFDDALAADFKTAWFERGLELSAMLSSISDTKARLSRWMTPEEVPVSAKMAEAGYSGRIHRGPYGVCLIGAPFNAPLVLTLDPLVAALAAGNTAIIKPSETTAHMASLFAELVPRYFDDEVVHISNGHADVMAELLALPFDFIFFTGSIKVGKVVMRAAAENLTPVLLELGGQNPVIVDETANIENAARTIVWGTMAFGGQWCVSPGYVYVHESVADDLVEACKKAITTFYGPDPRTSPDYSLIATQKDVDRLAGMLEGSTVVAGGSYDRETRYFDPTIVYPASWDAPIMDREIFGPILPILPYTDLDATIRTVQAKPSGLAAYIFTARRDVADHIIETMPFGGGAVNQAVIQVFMSSTLPFGGIGTSGIGRYHGKYGFDSLSHAKSVVVAPPDKPIDEILPPYTRSDATGLEEWFGPIDITD